MFQSAFIAFLPFLFFTVCVLIPLSFPSHSPLTGRPRHWREQRSLYLRLLVRKCQLFNWLPREASVKIPSLPSTGKTSDRNGISPSPCPTGGGWWHFSDQELAQPPPGTTEGPFARSPLHLWTKSLYSHFMAQRGSPRPRPRLLLGAAGEGSSVAKAIGAAGAVAVHPFCTLRFSPNKPCGCTSCSSHPLPLTSSCQLVSCPPSPTIHVVWMAAWHPRGQFPHRGTRGELLHPNCELSSWQTADQMVSTSPSHSAPAPVSLVVTWSWWAQLAFLLRGESPSAQLLDHPGCCDPSPMDRRGPLAVAS